MDNLRRTSLWKKMLLHLFWTLKGGKLSAFWKTFLGKVVKTAFYVSIGTLSRHFSWKQYINYFSFSNLVRKFWLLQNFFRQACQSCIILVQKITLGKNSSWKTLMFSDQIRTLSKNLLVFCGRFHGRFVTMAFYLSIRIFWEVFFGIFFSVFCHFPILSD